MINTENWCWRIESIAVTTSDHVTQKLLNWFIKEVWKSLKMWAREDVECCKQIFMGDSGRNLEDRKGDRNVASKGKVPEVSVGNVT